MSIRIILVLILSLITQACQAETKDRAVMKNNSGQEHVVEKTIMDFSKALADKDLDLLLAVSDAKEIAVVRRFTSGNLGGRGEPLSKFIPLSKINAELAVDVKNQTAFDIPGLFMNFPLVSFSAVPQRDLLPDANSTAFDQWESVLKASLEGTPEVVDGDPVILRSSRYYVYAEAQIITDILVGGFAVFELQNGKAKLVALIELL